MIPPVARRFVAGETAAEAIDHALTLNDRGVGAILNRLGEHYHQRAPADEDAAAYRRLLADVESMDACVSVKPSQVGLGVDESAFRENAAGIVEAAGPEGFVWFDMEDHTTTDATLDAVEALAAEHPWRVGVCLQANLKRTPGDLDRLASVPAKVRLVKGAYDEPASIAHQRRRQVDEAYEALLDQAFASFDRGVAVGSHDPRMIERAVDLGEEHGTGFEIQMLMGVRESAQYDLAREHDVSQYVPYGGKWFAYFYRRVVERKENAAFALRAILSG